MITQLHSFPPNPVTTTSTAKFQQRYYDPLTLLPLPFFSTISPNNNNKRRKFCVTCKAKGKTDTAKKDDYHATVRALNSQNRFPRKSLGQHYMVDAAVNDQLVAAGNVKEGDLVLEIGPGTGSLTNVLIEAGATVLAIEKDTQMAALVRERFADNDRFKVLQEDFTKCHIHHHIQSLLESKGLWGAKTRHVKVVANIPFNISKDVVKQLLPMGDIISKVVLLLQDETAARLTHHTSLTSSEHRPFNVFVQFYSDAEYIFKVPRTCFFPQPNVDAAVVSFKLKRPSDYPSVSSVKSYFSLVNSAFSGKRKMLRKSLQHICTASEIEAALVEIGLLATSRPEELTMDEFVKLHNSIINV